MGALIRSVCTLCGFTGVPTREIQGSLGVEILLWFFFIVPGLIYSVWRSGSKFDACPHCQKPSMVPSVSPNGSALIARNGGWSAAAEDVYMKALRTATGLGVVKSAILAMFIVWALIGGYLWFSAFLGLFGVFSVIKTTRLVMELRRP